MNGKLTFIEELKKRGLILDNVLNEKNFSKMEQKYNLRSLEDLYLSLGRGDISPVQVLRRLGFIKETEISLKKGFSGVKEDHRERFSQSGILVAGDSDILVRFAKCCNPIPGEPIIGIITKGRGVSIHRNDCPNLSIKHEKEVQQIDVSWSEDIKRAYPVVIEVVAFDRVGLLKDIVSQVSESAVNIAAADIKTKRGKLAIIKLVIDVLSISNLKEVLHAVRMVKDVCDTYRVTA